MSEKWKPLKDFEEQYKISSSGEIRTQETNRIRKAHSDKKGYLRISLYKNGQQFNKFIHRLVAKTFIENPQNKPQINHKDGNKANNTVDNLEWVTNQENAKHAWENGLYDKATKQKQGELNHSSKLTKENILWVRESDKPAAYLAEKLSVNVTTIYRIKNKETWIHVL